jgi:hypothetical protein
MCASLKSLYLSYTECNKVATELGLRSSCLQNRSVQLVEYARYVLRSKHRRLCFNSGSASRVTKISPAPIMYSEDLNREAGFMVISITVVYNEQSLWAHPPQN